MRRSRTQRELATARPIQSALFICHGNVCRSPFAAAVFQSAMESLGVRVSVESAGFIGPGRQPPPGALQASERRRVELSNHRSTLVTGAALNASDLVVVMGKDQAMRLRNRFGRPRGTLVVLGDLDPLPIERRTIRDPWGADAQVFDESYDRIERCVHELARILRDK